MRTSEYFISTLRETPADAEVVSQQLMLRAGMIRKLASGLYTWMPLGLRILNKVSQIVREEMNRAGALEVLMPVVQPAELWEETQRWDQFGPQLLKITDRQKREFCFGPTHEEVITDVARSEIRSYKQLPLNFYQIQVKFRDEIRPRFGVMRAREFLMKDAYSFHTNKNSLSETYQKMYDAYQRIFTRLGLNFRAVLADTGSIGGSQSHEFQVLAESGEDIIAYSDSSNFAANIELAEAIPESQQRDVGSKPCRLVDTPDQRSIAEVCNYLNILPSQSLKTLIVRGSDGGLVALVLRGDHELNAVKAEKLPQIAAPLTLASQEEIRQAIGCDPGYIGPLQLNMPIIADRSAYYVSDFVCGANQNGQHYQYVNWGRDLPEPQTADIRNVVEDDISPDGNGRLKLTRGIEVGHIFQLGNKYSAAMNATIQNETGQTVPMEMGCYGIGVSRIVAAAIEQHHDKQGILWPTPMAPFQIALVPIQYHRQDQVKKTTDELYQLLTAKGYEVLLDDRDERPGVMFADMDLIGIPLRIVISEKNLADHNIEYKFRNASQSDVIPLKKIDEILAGFNQA